MKIKLDYKFLFLFFVCVITTVLVLSHAWVTEDAFITFRYVDNTLSGYGPVFNIGERVQGYTHPLWFMLLLTGAGMGFDLFYYSILLGTTFNLLIVLIFGLSIIKQKRYYFTLSLFAIILYSCSSFLDFQTSGLENSLTHFLILLLIITTLKTTKHKTFKTTLFTALLLLNRLDLIFLTAPILTYTLITEKQKIKNKIKQTILGLTPIIMWETFSLIYYGSLTPNTAKAKLGAYTLLEGINKGLFYSFDFLRWELLPGITIIISILLTFTVFFYYKNLNNKLLLVIISSLSHISYLTLIGGDFMRGRFLLPAFFVTTITLSLTLKKFRIKKQIQAAFIILLLILSLISYFHAESATKEFNQWVVSERKYYEDTNSLFAKLKNESLHEWALEGIYYRERAKEENIIIIYGTIGMIGYYGGPNLTIIDDYGLTDPFISRSPVVPNSRPGHISHVIPEEYLLEREYGKITQTWNNTELQRLWKDIKLITQGEIFSMERFNAMLRVGII